MFEKLRTIIEGNDSIVIFGHIFPDGDCYGSQIGLRELIKLNYPEKKVYAVGSGLTRFFKLIGPMDQVSDEVIKNSLAILVDGNDCSRMEDQRVVTAKEFIKIDHHIENYQFTEGEFVVNNDVCSAAEMIVQMGQECGWKFNPTISNALFLGILTDSGRFQYIEDFALCFREAAFLVDNGANPKAINDILNLTSESALKFKGYVYSHYKKTKEGVIYLTFKKETLKKLKVSANKAGTMVNLLSNVLHYPIWCFFCENEDGTCHAEFRSSGPGVQPIAAKYGGGGHLQAAGVTLNDMSEQTVNMIIKDLNDAILDFKKEHK